MSAGDRGRRREIRARSGYVRGRLGSCEPIRIGGEVGNDGGDDGDGMGGG